MCCEDQKIQSGIDSAVVPIALSTTTQEALPQDDNRRLVILSAPISGTTTYGIGVPAVAGVGIVLGAGASPIKLTLRSDGNVVKKSIHVIHSAGSVACGIIIGVETTNVCP